MRIKRLTFKYCFCVPKQYLEINHCIFFLAGYKCQTQLIIAAQSADLKVIPNDGSGDSHLCIQFESLTNFKSLSNVSLLYSFLLGHSLFSLPFCICHHSLLSLTISQSNKQYWLLCKNGRKAIHTSCERTKSRCQSCTLLEERDFCLQPFFSMVAFWRDSV